MVLYEINDIIVKLPHVCELRDQHGVASPESFIILRQRRHRAVVVTSNNRDSAASSARGRKWGRVTPIGLLVRVRGGDAQSALKGEETRTAIDAKWRMRVVMMMVLAVYAYLRLSSFPPMDLTQQMLLPLLEKLVGKLPSVRHDLSKTLVFPNTQAKQRDNPFQ